MIVERGGLPAQVSTRSTLMLDVVPPTWAMESQGGWGASSDPSVLPAASAAMRLISNDISSLPLLVYRETDQNGNAEKARDSWQWELLHQSPMPGLAACQFWFDVTMGIISRGNSHALKLFDGKRLSALQFMGGTVNSRLDQAGSVVYDWSPPQQGTIIRGIPAGRVVHWRGPNFDGGRDGVSLIQWHRGTFETGVVQDGHQNALYRNGALPKIAFGTTARLSEEQVDEWINRYEARHKGAHNAGRPILLSEGTTIQQVSVTPEDAQFLEQRQYNIADVERIFLLPPATLQESKTRPAVDADLVHRYVRQTLQPLLVLIEQTLEADPDIFGPGSSLYPEFQTGAILKADIGTRYAAYLQGRQAGWLSVNDIRAAENLPPIPEGDQYQTTPVGGAPNLQPADGGAQQQQNDGAERALEVETRAALTAAVISLARDRREAPVAHVHNRFEPPQAHVTVESAQVRVDSPVTVEPAQITVQAAETPNVTVDAPISVNVPPPAERGRRQIKVKRDKDGRPTCYEETDG